MQRTLLAFGVAGPVLYYVALIGASLLYPGYSHVTQYASELGAAAAPFPQVFNLTIIGAGLATALGGVGVALALASQYGAKVTGWLTGLCLIAFGVAYVMGGLFPMPNPLHGGFGLGMAVQLAPLLALIALRKAPDHKALKLFLLAVFVASAVLFLIMMGVGGLVRRANVGLWQRAYTLSCIPWIAVLSWTLLRATRRTSA